MPNMPPGPTMGSSYIDTSILMDEDLWAPIANGSSQADKTLSAQTDTMSIDADLPAKETFNKDFDDLSKWFTFSALSSPRPVESAMTVTSSNGESSGLNDSPHSKISAVSIPWGSQSPILTEVSTPAIHQAAHASNGDLNRKTSAPTLNRTQTSHDDFRLTADRKEHSSEQHGKRSRSATTTGVGDFMPTIPEDARVGRSKNRVISGTPTSSRRLSSSVSGGRPASSTQRSRSKEVNRTTAEVAAKNGPGKAPRSRSRPSRRASTGPAAQASSSSLAKAASSDGLLHIETASLGPVPIAGEVRPPWTASPWPSNQHWPSMEAVSSVASLPHQMDFATQASPPAGWLPQWHPFAPSASHWQDGGRPPHQGQGLSTSLPQQTDHHQAWIVPNAATNDVQAAVHPDAQALRPFVDSFASNPQGVPMASPTAPVTSEHLPWWPGPVGPTQLPMNLSSVPQQQQQQQVHQSIISPAFDGESLLRFEDMFSGAAGVNGPATKSSPNSDTRSPVIKDGTPDSSASSQGSSKASDPTQSSHGISTTGPSTAREKRQQQHRSRRSISSRMDLAHASIPEEDLSVDDESDMQDRQDIKTETFGCKGLTTEASEIVLPSNDGRAAKVRNVSTSNNNVSGSSITARPVGSRPKKTEAEKRKKRRESHNLVERRRRDAINERIAELATLLPETMLLDAIAHSQMGGNVSKVVKVNMPLSAMGGGVAAPCENDLEGGDHFDSTDLSHSSLAPAHPSSEALAAAQARPNKGIILSKSVDYIRALQEFITRQERRNEGLEEELQREREMRRRGRERKSMRRHEANEGAEVGMGWTAVGVGAGGGLSMPLSDLTSGPARPSGSSATATATSGALATTNAPTNELRQATYTPPSATPGSSTASFSPLGDSGQGLGQGKEYLQNQVHLQTNHHTNGNHGTTSTVPPSLADWLNEAQAQRS